MKPPRIMLLHHKNPLPSFSLNPPRLIRHIKITFRRILLKTVNSNLINRALRRRLISSQPMKPRHPQPKISRNNLITNLTDQFRSKPSNSLRNVNNFQSPLIRLQTLEKPHQLPQSCFGKASSHFTHEDRCTLLVQAQDQRSHRTLPRSFSCRVPENNAVTCA